MAEGGESRPWDVLIGKWEVYKSENFEEFLQASGVNLIMRKLAPKARAVLDIKVEGDTIHMGFTVGIKSMPPAKFIVDGPETEVKMFMGEAYKAKTTWEDGKQVTEMTPKDPKDSHKAHRIIREVVNGELIQTMIIGDVVAKRYLKKI